MEKKKSKQADLESKRVGFIFLGLISASAFVLMAFSLSSVTISPISKIIVLEDDVKDDLIYDFFKDEPIQLEPQEQEIPPAIDEVIEVEDDIVIEPVDFIDPSLIDLNNIITTKETDEFVPRVIVPVSSVSPKFPGGEGEMATFINENFEYPSISVEMGEQGVVYIEFVVYDDGTIVDTKVVKSVSPAIDKEAIRVVKKNAKMETR